MKVTNQEKKLYGKGVQVISRTEQCTIYKIEDETGNMMMTNYHVFRCGVNIISLYSGR